MQSVLMFLRRSARKVLNSASPRVALALVSEVAPEELTLEVSLGADKNGTLGTSNLLDLGAVPKYL